MIDAAAIDGHPSYFETVTAMAFCVFAGQVTSDPCGCSVIEVGLGGRLDATNVVLPEIAVITPISYDHESFLGNTLPAIAGEKAGIIKHGVPVVVAHQSPEAAEVIMARATSIDAPFISADQLPVEDAAFTPTGCSFHLGSTRFECNLPGRHQLENAVTAVGAARQLGLADDVIATGIAAAQWPGRLEYVHRNPDIILDGAHNPAGAKALANYIQEFLANRPVWLVYGTMRDKAIDEVVDTLFPLADRLILTAPDTPRALRPESLMEMASHPNALVAPDLASAWAIATQAPPDAAVVFSGSLFLVGEARALANVK